MSKCKHILVPTDFSDCADAALDLALHVAGRLEAHVTLLHVFMLPVIAYGDALPFPVEGWRKQAEQALEAAHRVAAKKYADIAASLVDGTSWEAIVDYARERQVDLVVMGSHGRRGLSRVLIGSTTERVVRLSTVPVLVVPGRR